MTKDRKRKQDIRARMGASGRRYTAEARQEPVQVRPESIRTYTGEIHICTTCGQPAHDSEQGPSHFTEQADAVFCQSFPAATGLIPMSWDGFSLQQVQERYPWPAVSAKPECTGHHSAHDRFRDTNRTVLVCTLCGQPGFDHVELYGFEHFPDQWDGIHCERHPLAGTLVAIDWHPRSLADWKAGYECTYPH